MQSPDDDANAESGGARAKRAWTTRWRAAAERQPLGGIAAAALICLLVMVAVVAWPALVAGLGQASRAVTEAPHPPAQARVQAGTPPGLAPGRESTIAPTSPPVSEPATPAPQPQPQPVAQPAPPVPQSQQAAQPPPSQQPPPAQAPPPQTPPGSRIVQTSTSGWNYVNHGGFPNFTGTMVWTTNSGATATWSTDLRSNAVTVQVWITNWMAGAVVSYTVTGAQQYAPVQITQEWVSGWQTLGTFASNGTISVVMRYVAVGHPQATPDPACINSTQCTAMAAAQMQFSWG